MHLACGLLPAIYVSFPKGSHEEECRLLSISFQEQAEDLRVHIGYASFPGQDVVKEMYTSVKHAVHMAKYGISSEKYTFVTQHHRLLQNEDIHTQFMPIVDLRDGMPLGWEALAQQAALMKKMAKSMPGTVFVADEGGPHGPHLPGAVRECRGGSGCIQLLPRP
ncbi:hypothetical protein [Brevibacillus borstelensis]|uniref:hypothetical protein n=1 Tax=Brevibacillus borstelensis TaxID=45462 RepID=UPI0030C0BF8A